MEEQMYDELLIELECPICTNYMSTPIRLCATGHSICTSCCEKLQKCALCETKFTDSRNLSLESLALKMRYPCINRSLGCTVKLTYDEKDSHEMRCPCKSYKCAMDKCRWEGTLEDLAAHWTSKATSSKPYYENNVCHTKMKIESYYVNMVEAFSKLFWFKFKIVNNKLFWAVQYLGDAEEAKNYYFEIEIFKFKKAQKKIVMSDYCQAIDVENSQLFTDENCISVSVETVSSFVRSDQSLTYYFRVVMVKDKKQVAEEKPQSKQK